ncbi:MAG TPA: phosphoribosylamine--glycine ligase [Chloroflexota bacterium]|nr:phosphoribosylamine--glycine ligase [Chloroflexota bacterium]
MKILVVGSGGREHALAWHLLGEGVQVLVAPGNAGISETAEVPVTDVDGLVGLAQRERVDLTIVGPETPLALGLVDVFAVQGLAAFGPTRGAARLEWSKAWTKDFLRRRGIPTGAAEVVESESGARDVVERLGLPVVLKADGLAAGKGVFVALTEGALEDALDQLFRRKTMGGAAEQVLVEEFLEGPELSVLAFTDGERFALMPPARDYKRLRDGDLGPNTGGMGGYARPGYATREVLDDIEARVLEPTLAGMAAEGQAYRGVLYTQVMLTRDGPRVIEFNCRFGDPECQLIMPLLQSRLSDVCAGVVSGQFRPDEIRWHVGRTCGVVLAAPGYPEAPRLGGAIAGLADVSEDVLVFHAGTRRDHDGRLVTSGGRVLSVVGFERDAVYAAAKAIRFDGKQFRGDIGTELEPLSPPRERAHTSLLRGGR